MQETLTKALCALGYNLVVRGLVVLIIVLGSWQCGHPDPKTHTAPPSISAPVVDGLSLDQRHKPLVFTDGGFVKVEIVALTTPLGTPLEALFRVTGVENRVANHTMRATHRSDMHGTVTWTVQLDGEPMVLLSTRAQPKAKPQESLTFLKLPKMRNNLRLRAESTPPSLTIGEELLAEHRRQRDSGALAKITSFDRKDHLQRQSERLARHSQRLLDACGARISLHVDWNSLSDENLREGIHCASEMAAMEKLCQRDMASRRLVTTRIQRVECSKGPEQSFDLEGGTLRVAAKHRSRSQTAAREAWVYKKLKAEFNISWAVFQSAEGKYLMLDPYREESSLVYAGDQKQLFQQFTYSSSRRSREFWNGPYRTIISQQNPGLWNTICEGRNVEFRQVPDSVRDKLLKTATLEKPRWNRTEHALARDKRGIYYYVDRLDAANGGKGYRVFVGPRGSLQLTTLVDIVEDSKGMIFSTKSGKLRLIVGKAQEPQVTWIEGKRQRNLTFLPVGENRELIYKDLGQYSGINLGTICSP